MDSVLYIIAAVIVGAWLLLALLGSLQKKRAAKKILKLHKDIYSTRHEYRYVNPEDFRHLDLAFYDQTRDWFLQRGFRQMADIEDVTLRELGVSPFRPVFIRTMLSGDGRIMVGIYHARAKGKVRLFQILGLMKPAKMFKIIDLETEFSDGRFLTTSNSLETDPTTPPPGLKIDRWPWDTPPEELLRAHERSLEILLSDNPDLVALRFSSCEDMEESQHRMQQIKNAHRKATGYMSAEELEQIAGSSLQPQAEEVGELIEQVKEREERDRLDKTKRDGLVKDDTDG